MPGWKTAICHSVFSSFAIKRLLIIFLTSNFCLNAFLVWSGRQKIAEGYAEFTIFYSAADIIRAGQGRDLYNQQIQYRVQATLATALKTRNSLPSNHPPFELPYNHPPFEALLFLPLSCMAYLHAYFTWMAINLAMLFASAGLLHRAGVLKMVSTAKLFLLACLFFPVFLTLYKGQDLILLLLITCGSLALMKDNADFWAGFVLGFGVFRPELALPIALVIAFPRRRAFTAGFIFSGLAMVGVSARVVGWHSLLFYPKYVMGIELLSQHSSIVSMPNLHGLLLVFIHAQPIAVIFSALLPLFVAAYVLRSRSSGYGTTEEVFGVAILFSLLVSYHAFPYDLALLVLPLAFTSEKLALILDQSFNVLRLLGFAGPVAFFLCTPLLVWLWIGFGLFSFVAVVLALWLWMACRAKEFAQINTQNLSLSQV